jgi:hypothetical protein
MADFRWLQHAGSLLGGVQKKRGVSERRRSAAGWLSCCEAIESRLMLSAVRPYLQNPTSDGMTVIWFTESNVSGKLTVSLPGGGSEVFNSAPEFRPELSYHASEALTGRSGAAYMHRIRVTGLSAETAYSYTVNQGTETYTGQLRTSPLESASVRFMVYADSETEPESTGNAVVWTQPGVPGSTRRYVADQTEGYRQNINVIKSRNPDFIGIAGDIVESGGEQRDWDEFWRHNAGDLNNIASSTPIFAAPGNHEDYGGPGAFGGYSDEGSIRGRDKFKTYWETPNNGSPGHEDRYYRVDYGPITYISLDVTNGKPHATGSDTNWLLGDGPGYPDFNPGSVQYQWLEAQLADAQANSQFMFIQLHHVPYSTGPHGFAPGNGAGFDTQSGQPVRVLTPLFTQYGVDAVFSGHDETYQHSIVNGIHFWDIGIGGDGLRGPSSGPDSANPSITTNPYQHFTAHLNAPEVWDGERLVSGGKHYGHLEINVFQEAGFWKTRIDPVHVFPVMNATGDITGWERRVYNDTVILTGDPIPSTVSITASDVEKLEGQTGRTPFTFNVTRSGNTSIESRVQYVVSQGSEFPADAADFGGTFPAGTVTFAPGQTTATITVDVTGDTTVEANERFRVTLMAPGPGTVLGANLTAGGVIRNDDVLTSQGPVISAFDTAVTYIEKTPGIILDTNVTVADADSVNFAGGRLTVTVSSGLQSTDRIGIRHQGTAAGQIGLDGTTVKYGNVPIGTFSGTTSLIVTLNDKATAAAVQALLRSIWFYSTSSNPSVTARKVRVSLTDGDGGTSNQPEKTVNVKGVNDAPVISAFDTAVTYIEKTPGIILDTNVTVADVDSANFAGGRLTATVSSGLQSTDRIGIRHQGTAAGQIGVDGTTVKYGNVPIGTFSGTTSLIVTLNDKATAAAVQALLRSIWFYSTSSNPSVTARKVRVSLTDGDGGTSNQPEKTVNVKGVNDAPVISGFDTAVTYIEKTPGIILDTNVTVADADSVNFAGGRLTATVTSGLQSTDRIGIRHQGTAAGQIGVDGTTVKYGNVPIGTFSGTTSLIVTLNDKATAAAVQALLRSIWFYSTSSNPSVTARKVRVSLTDGDGGTSNQLEKTVNIKPVNDAPVVGSFEGSVAYKPGSAGVILDSNATVTDVDSANFAGGRLTATVSSGLQSTDRIGIRHQGTAAGQIGVDGTTVKYGNVPIGTFSGTTSLIVTLNDKATVAAVQALLRSIWFYSTSSNPSVTARKVRVSLTDGDGGTSNQPEKTVSISTVAKLAAARVYSSVNSAPLDDIFADDGLQKQLMNL